MLCSDFGSYLYLYDMELSIFGVHHGDAAPLSASDAHEIWPVRKKVKGAGSDSLVHTAQTSEPGATTSQSSPHLHISSRRACGFRDLP